MGMFDYILCEYPLVDKEIQNKNFQTKSLHCVLDQYKIGKDGQLYIDNNTHIRCKGLKELELAEVKESDWVPISTTECIYFYTFTDDDHKWFEYKAIFDNGKLVSLDKIE